MLFGILYISLSVTIYKILTLQTARWQIDKFKFPAPVFVSHMNISNHYVKSAAYKLNRSSRWVNFTVFLKLIWMGWGERDGSMGNYSVLLV